MTMINLISFSAFENFDVVPPPSSGDAELNKEDFADFLNVVSVSPNAPLPKLAEMSDAPELPVKTSFADFARGIVGSRDLKMYPAITFSENSPAKNAAQNLLANNSETNVFSGKLGEFFNLKTAEDQTLADNDFNREKFAQTNAVNFQAGSQIENQAENYFTNEIDLANAPLYEVSQTNEQIPAAQTETIFAKTNLSQTQIAALNVEIEPQKSIEDSISLAEIAGAPVFAEQNKTNDSIKNSGAILQPAEKNIKFAAFLEKNHIKPPAASFSKLKQPLKVLSEITAETNISDVELKQPTVEANSIPTETKPAKFDAAIENFSFDSAKTESTKTENFVQNLNENAVEIDSPKVESAVENLEKEQRSVQSNEIKNSTVENIKPLKNNFPIVESPVDRKNTKTQETIAIKASKESGKSNLKTFLQNLSPIKPPQTLKTNFKKNGLSETVNSPETINIKPLKIEPTKNAPTKIVSVKIEPENEISETKFFDENLPKVETSKNSFQDSPIVFNALEKDLPMSKTTNGTPNIKTSEVDSMKIETKSPSNYTVEAGEIEPREINLSASKHSVESADLKISESKNFKDEKVSETTENEFAFNFEKFLTAATKQSKTAETAPKSIVENRQILEQVEPQVLQIISSMSRENEKKTMKMRLHPAELGAIEINLEKNAAGKITAHFHTETEAARQNLSQNIEQLRNSLQDSGWQVDRLNVTCQQSSPNGGESNANHSRQTETVERKLNSESDFNRNSTETGDSNPSQPNRLLSVRA